MDRSSERQKRENNMTTAPCVVEAGERRMKPKKAECLVIDLTFIVGVLPKPCRGSHNR